MNLDIGIARSLATVFIGAAFNSAALADISKAELQSIQTRDSVKTSIGTLKFFDGVPTRETANKVYDPQTGSE